MQREDRANEWEGMEKGEELQALLPRWTTLETLAKGQLGFHPRVPRWAAAIGAHLASQSGAPPSPSRVNIDVVEEVCMETP